MSHGGGRGDVQGKGGVKETSRKEQERVEAAGAAETDAGAAESNDNNGDGAAAGELGGEGTGLPLGQTVERYAEGVDSQQRLEAESGRAVKKTKQRGGALLMQPLMRPGWTPPAGRPPGAPQDKDEDMTETRTWRMRSLESSSIWMTQRNKDVTKDKGSRASSSRTNGLHR